METLANKLYFKCDGERYYFKNGVPQGMATSPACFDIYMEDFLKTVKERLLPCIDFWYLAYADDLVFGVDYNELVNVLRIVEDTA